MRLGLFMCFRFMVLDVGMGARFIDFRVGVGLLLR